MQWRPMWRIIPPLWREYLNRAVLVAGWEISTVIDCIGRNIAVRQSPFWDSFRARVALFCGNSRQLW